MLESSSVWRIKILLVTFGIVEFFPSFIQSYMANFIMICLHKYYIIFYILLNKSCFPAKILLSEIAGFINCKLLM